MSVHEIFQHSKPLKCVFGKGSVSRLRMFPTKIISFNIPLNRPIPNQPVANSLAHQFYLLLWQLTFASPPPNLLRLGNFIISCHTTTWSAQDLQWLVTYCGSNTGDQTALWLRPSKLCWEWTNRSLKRKERAKKAILKNSACCNQKSHCNWYVKE